MENHRIFKTALERERKARKAAEQILEAKSLELYNTTIELEKANLTLENKVEESQNKLTIAARLDSQNPHPIVQVDKQRKVHYMNAVAMDLFGKDLGVLPPEVFDCCDRVLQTGFPSSGEFEIDKRIFSVSICPSALAQVCDLYFTEITNEKRQAQRLALSEGRYRRIVEGSSDLIIKTSPQGKVLFVNRSTRELFNNSKGSLIGKGFDELLRKGQINPLLSSDLIGDSGESMYKSEVFFDLPKHGDLLFDLRAYPNQDNTTIICRDITRAKDVEDKLKMSEQKYRSVIENMNLGLLEVDNENVITRVYKHFCTLTGYSEQELVGKKAVDVLLNDQSVKNKILSHQTSRLEGVESVYEAIIRKKDGSDVYFLISGAPLYDEYGTVRGSIGIHLDITTRKNTELELIQQRVKAEDSNRAKEQFLANMSHEIRTPMNVIIGMSDILKRSKMDEKQAKMVEAIETSSKNLLVIINDILDLTKVESGKMTIEHVGFDLRKLLGHLDQTHRMKAESKGILLSLNINIDVPQVVVGDPVRLNQIVTNLVGNALKFTARGTVTVKVSVRRVHRGVSDIKIEVTDTGNGINEDVLDKIFVPFDQEDNSITRKFGGTGLGLPITKKLVELLGGAVSVKSIEGVGSVFSVQVPYSIGTEDDLPEEQNQTLNLKGLNGLKVLLAEDNKFNQILVQTLFIEHGVDLTIVENGIEAAEMANNESFDLLLMDIQMPEMGGVEATRLIRNIHSKEALPIVALTANAFTEDRNIYIDGGMNDCVSKPFVANELYYVMLENTNRLSPEKNIEPAMGEPDVAACVEEYKEGKLLYSLDRLMLMFNNKEAAVLKMVRSFVQHTPKLLDEIEAATAKKNWQQLSSLAHRLKSGLNLFDVSCIEQKVIEIEKNAESGSPDYITTCSTTIVREARVLVKQLMDHLEN